ncbi:hypothetical protein EI94DRAFT_1826162, partial [Lactarius quietus]
MAPLRDRPPSNATDPPQPVTPLRIAKRDTPGRPHASQLSRRSSNTFAKLTRSNLVSQSPFRSQVSSAPAPSRPSSVVHVPAPRRVSGEKRPRPDSMQSQVENERPLGFKRRQSKGFQDLIEKEPVSKSPFRRPASPVEDPFPPPPPPPKVIHTSHLPTPSSSASPGRSSLVSKRLHGPRLIGHDVPKRQRRKTVTFDETCDVVTFERDDSLDSDIFSDDDEFCEPEEYGEPAENVDANDSITGLVDSMIQDARDASNPQTPPMDRSLPQHIDSQDGVPYGRTHHADRAALSRHSHPNTPLEILETLTSVAKQSPSVPSTPPQADRMADDVEDDVRMLPPSPSPAKIKKHSLPDRSENLLPKFDLDIHRQDVNDESGSEHAHSFSLPGPDDVQIVELSFLSSEGHSESLSEMVGAFRCDPQAVELEELGVVVQSTPNSQIQASTPPLRLKIPGGSLGKMSESPSSRELPRPPTSRSESPIPPRMASPFWSHSESPSLVHRGSPSFPPSGSPAFAAPSHVAPPFSLSLESVQTVGSLGSRGSIGSLSGRSPRIDREDIHKRLLRKRNTDSPVPEELGEMSAADRSTSADPTEVSLELGDDSLVPPQPSSVHRDGTYDGVMSIDPNPQPADPPRPSLVVRAQSELEPGDTHSAGTAGFQTRIRHVSPGLDIGLGAPGSTRVEIDEVQSALERLVQNVVTDSANASMSARPSPHGHISEGSHTALDIAAVTKGIEANMYDPPGDYDDDVMMEEDEKLDSQRLTPDKSTTPSSAQRTPELLSGG